MKFGRIYSLNVQGQTGNWTIAYPLTLKMNVSCDGSPTANAAHLIIHNLSEQVRKDIFLDYFNGTIYRQVIFAAGYENQPIPVVFQGNVQWAYSYRQGPDWITEIDCVDGGHGIANSNVSLNLGAGYTTQQVLTQMAASLKTSNIAIGHISSTFNVPNTRGITVTGNTWEVLTRMMAARQAQVFISKETVNIIGLNEYLPGVGALGSISSDTGLIGSPRIQNLVVTATLLFEPRLEIGQYIYFSSAEISGQYLVSNIQHRGTISGTECGDFITTVTLLMPPNLQAAA